MDKSLKQVLAGTPPYPQFWGSRTARATFLEQPTIQSPPELGDLGGEKRSNKVRLDCAGAGGGASGGLSQAEPGNETNETCETDGTFASWGVEVTATLCLPNCPSVLSIIEEYLGHKTYGQLMRRYFNASDNCEVDFYWYNEEKEFRTRVINRLLSYRPSNSWMQEQHITLHLLRIQLGFAYMTRRLLLRKLSQQNILHFHTQPLAYLATDLMAKIPTVVTIDRTIAQASREKTYPAFQWTFVPNHFLEKRVFQAAAKVVSFSEAARRSVIEDYQIDEDKVQVIYPGVDLQKIPQKPAVSDSEAPFRILFIGGDFQRKGGDDLLQVFLERFADRAELHLVTTAPIQCDHSKVHIYRHIQAYTPEWLALYHRADVFVLPTYSEPFGWVFIEAMAAGLPIIATHHNAIPEIVSHGETGFLVQPGDRPSLAHHLQLLLENPELRTAMGIKGRQIAEQKFDVNQHFQKLESLFQEIGGQVKS